MALQDILKRILFDTDLEIQKEASDCQQEIQKISEQAEKEWQEEKILLEQKTIQKIKKMEERLSFLLYKESQRKELQVKNKILKSILTHLLQTLENADEKSYGLILKKLFSSLPSSSGKILTPPKRMEITSHYAPKNCEVKADKDVQSGFIFQNGNLEIDNSFQNLIFSEFYDDLVQYIAHEFGWIGEI